MGTDRISWTSDTAPTTQFIVEADRIGQSVSGNYTTVRVYLQTINRGDTSSYSGYPGYQKVSIDGIWDGAKHSGTPFLPDGYSNGEQRWHDGPWDIKVPHNSDGTRGPITLRMTLNYDNYPVISKQFTASFDDFPDLGTVPPAPKPLGIDEITQNSMRYRFLSNGDGGPAILEWQIGYGTSSTAPQKFIDSNGTSTLTGLSRYTTYYVWSRGRNAIGWGPLSARSSARTLAYVPAAPVVVGVSDITQTSLRYQFTDGDNGGSNVLEKQIGYGTDPNTVQTMIPSDGDDVISGLSPGTLWYVWARERNVQGWGPWSARSSARTIAGAWIKVAGIWKLAVPYVKVAGIWKLAQPYVKVAGIWKKTL